MIQLLENKHNKKRCTSGDSIWKRPHVLTKLCHKIAPYSEIYSCDASQKAKKAALIAACPAKNLLSVLPKATALTDPGKVVIN